MRMIDADAVERALPFDALVDALDAMFRDGCEVPVRHHHAIGSTAGAGGTLLLMPAWQTDEVIGVKIVSVFADNAKVGLPSVQGVYLVLDGTTGAVQALLDAARLTVRRTAAASGLAGRYLARADATRMLMVGAGALAPNVVRAHASQRPIEEVRVWNRTAARARALADELARDGFRATVEADLEAGCGWADIVSCATLSSEPLVHGRWLKPGSHLDLIGGFTPKMREADDDAVTRATVFVDTRAGCLKEGGDVVDPIARGVIAATDVAADLFELARGEHPGRASDDEITFFKSVGTALEDLAAARLCLARA